MRVLAELTCLRVLFFEATAFLDLAGLTCLDATEDVLGFFALTWAEALAFIFTGSEPTIRQTATAGADFTSTHSLPVHPASALSEADQLAAQPHVAKTRATRQAKTATERTEDLVAMFRFISCFSFCRLTVGLDE